MSTVGELRRALARRLQPVAERESAVEADRLLGDVVGGSPTELTLKHDEVLTPEQIERLEESVRSRLTGRPLAYVLGHVAFFDLDFYCDERAMVPRPETEEALEIALGCLPAPAAGAHPLAIDVGTGSGNLALSLAYARPDLRVIAIDVSLAALELAHQNALRHDLMGRVSFVRGRTLSMISVSGPADLIVSNPPYIVPGDPLLEQMVADHEPHVALYAGPSGLEIIGELIEEGIGVLRPGGWFVCEVGFEQAPHVGALVSATEGWETPAFHRDLAGIERTLAVRRR